MKRVQALIAASGLCSRREAERYIQAGRVHVNGKSITIGDKALETDTITVDGKEIKPAKKVYLALNKPLGYECTLGYTRKARVIDLINTADRLIHVGRLDHDSHGLILLTNDGEFANAVMHPRYEHEKVYVVSIKGILSPRDIQRVGEGVMIDGRKTAPVKISIINQTKDRMKVEMRLSEGRNRQIRKMLQTYRVLIEDLERVKIGPVTLKNLALGKYRALTPSEISVFTQSLNNVPKRKLVHGRRTDDRRRTPRRNNSPKRR